MTRLLILLLAVASSAVGAQDAPPVALPVPELPGQGRPVDLEATRARRERLLQRVGPGVVIVRASSLGNIAAQVLQDNDFRQDDDFFYLTMLETPDAWLLLAAGSSQFEVHLFLPPRKPSEERWTGLRLGPGPEAVRLSGIAAVHDVSRLDSVASAVAERTPGPVHVVQRYSKAAPELPAAFTGRPVRNIVPVLDSLRLIKDATEIAALRRAVDITTNALRAAMQAAQPGMMEYQLEAVVEYHFRRAGADRVGFPSIVGSGPNATTLHYDVNRRQMQAGELVVIDVGAEYAQYTADVTRTLPLGGRFTPRQRAIYDLVLGSQQAALDAVRPGVTVLQLTRVAQDYMRRHSGDLCAPKNCVEYFVHGLSHWLGMRVHDVGDYRTPLEPGMVLTVEPGIYLPDEHLGVRIEDDIVVTAGGYELLSARAPRRAEDVEALMNEPSRAEPLPGGARR